MIAECQYGGRVTDDFDKRLLSTFVFKWFGDPMFAPQFVFSENAKSYVIPRFGRIDELMSYIFSLPNSDRPEVFGLHGNADITYQTNTAKTVLNTILNIQPKESSGGSGETRESVVHRIAQDMLDKLPPDYISYEVKARLIKMDALTSMNIFLRQEIDRMQKVISTVRRTLIDLKLAIDGTIIMNESLRNALDFIYDAKIPNLWMKISWESSTLGFWFTELIERNNQFRKWLFEDKPVCYWMTGFFNAQGFLTAMRQVRKIVSNSFFYKNLKIDFKNLGSDKSE
jgi:dynein heavy chain